MGSSGINAEYMGTVSFSLSTTNKPWLLFQNLSSGTSPSLFSISAWTTSIGVYLTEFSPLPRVLATPESSQASRPRWRTISSTRRASTRRWAATTWRPQGQARRVSQGRGRRQRARLYRPGRLHEAMVGGSHHEY